MKQKVIAALHEEVLMLKQADDSQIERHIYTMEKLLDILRSGDKESLQPKTYETIKEADKREDKSDSIFDF